ncbi:MAG TPA: hypothetical protein ENN47_09710 [Mesotoga infera]|uniref:GP-PDE domain-containing protein n=1 Tax=Mesotoga infera TaxID=1236046 RepID=A0A7C1GRW9_9BACT|nr:hypothetical protein [Mesotoga infera]
MKEALPTANMGLGKICLYLERMASKSLTFMVLTKVFFSFVTVPLIALLLGSFFSFSGRKMVFDWGFLNLADSFPGMVIFMTVAFLWLLCFSFEQSGLVRFSSAALKNSEERVVSVLKRILRIFPRLLGLAAFKAGILLLCAVPAFRILPALGRTFTRQLPVGTYPSVGTGAFGWIAAMLSLLVVSRLLISWVFAIHYAVLEGKTFVGSLKASTNLVNGSRKRVLLTMLAFWPLSLLLIIANSTVFRVSRDFVIRSSCDPTSMNILKLSVFASVETMITTALSIGVSVIYSILMTRLFYELKEGYSDDEATSVTNPVKTKSLTLQRPWILPLLIFLAIQGVFFGYFGRFLVDSEIELPLVTAHRGSSFKAPENSLSAIRAAFEDGADIIEIDVQMTRDGILVLNHDRSLTKVAGVGERVHNLSFAEIADLDIGSRFSKQFSGERIPTLAEVITYMTKIPSSVRLNVELKDYGYSPGISEAVVQLIKEMDFSDRVMITSTSIERLSAVRELAPDISIGLIVGYLSSSVWNADVDFYSVPSTILNQRFIQRARSLERDVHVWTINNTEAMSRYSAMGVASIITDRPDVLSRLLLSQAQMSIFQLRVLSILMT